MLSGYVKNITMKQLQEVASIALQLQETRNGSDCSSASSSGGKSGRDEGDGSYYCKSNNTDQCFCLAFFSNNQCNAGDQSMQVETMRKTAAFMRIDVMVTDARLAI